MGRQAVNTRVQGSAADLVKRAMINVERRLERRLPDCRVPHRGAEKEVVARREKLGVGKTTSMGMTTIVSTTTSTNDSSPPRGAFLVLQLHDELIYEVNAKDLQEVATIVKTEMENAWPNLKVKFPVKLKMSTSWSSMEEYNV